MKNIFIIGFCAGVTTFAAHAGDEKITLADERKLDEAKHEANVASAKWWIFSNLSTTQDDARTERWQDKTEEKLLQQAKIAIRKERAIEKQIQKKRRRAKL